MFIADALTLVSAVHRICDFRGYKFIDCGGEIGFAALAEIVCLSKF